MEVDVGMRIHPAKREHKKGSGYLSEIGRMKEITHKKNRKEGIMENLTGACGITCSECDAFIATKNNDDQLRIKTAEKWSGMYDADLKPEDIHCKGCLSAEEPRFVHCTMCKIRECVLGRGLENCAPCDDFVCEKLQGFLQYVPDALKTLEDIRKSL